MGSLVSRYVGKFICLILFGVFLLVCVICLFAPFFAFSYVRVDAGRRLGRQYTATCINVRERAETAMCNKTNKD